MLKLHESEYKLISIVWDNEPIKSKELTIVSEEKLGWKRTTTYTVLKKLITKNFLKNENTVVTSLIKKKDVQKYECEEIINNRFNGSLTGFITSFVNGKKLSKEEVEHLQNLINEHKEES